MTTASWIVPVSDVRGVVVVNIKGRRGDDDNDEEETKKTHTYQHTLLRLLPFRIHTLL